MSDVRPDPERIDLAHADDPRDVVHRAVACLAQGGVVALPTETAYSLAASALNADSVERLVSLRGRQDPPGLMPLAVRGPEELIDWAPDASVVARRLARRSWPGPLILILRDGVDRGLARRLPAATREAVGAGETVGLRCPSQEILQDILHLMAGPLVLTSARPLGGEAIRDPAGLLGRAGIDLILDDGLLLSQSGSTVVRVVGPSWTIERPGVLDAEELTRRCGTVLLFVCTGNTCRSPMAAGLCRLLLAERLGCGPGQLAQRGYIVLSAGVAARDGMPASRHAVEVLRERGASLEEHSSRQLSGPLVQRADMIVTMTRDHRDVLLEDFPEAAPRVRPLHAQGGDIVDPFGSDQETYLRTARQIEEHLVKLLDEIALGTGPTGRQS